MAKKHPVEPLVDQITKLLDQYDGNLEKKVEGKITEELFTQMATLEMRVGAADEAFRIAMEKVGLTEQDLANVMRNPENMPRKDLRVYKRLGTLGKEVGTLYRAMERAEEKNRQSIAKTGKPVKRRLGDSSSNLGIGFRKGWNKL